MSAFRHRNYQLFFGGQLISLTGTWMQSVAEAWLVYRLTGSSALLGMAAFVSQVPIFLFSTVGGAVADRLNRHHIVIVTQTVSMLLPLTLAGLTFAGIVRVWHIFALGACLGVVNAFDVPARHSFIADMVDRKDLGNAIALNSSMVNGARIVGPALAGVLIAAVGERWCFLFNGLSYIGVIGGLLLMKVPAPPLVDARPPVLRDTIDGFRFVLDTTPVRTILVLLGLVSLVGMPYAVLMPIFADQILRGGPLGLGLLGGASGLGALIGALSLALRGGARNLGQWVAASVALFGLTLVLFSLSRVFWLSALVLLPAGGAMMVQIAASNTLIQAMVPDRLRGRVMAVYSMMFMGMAPFGGLLAGAVAERIGAPRTVAVGGLACLLAAVAFTRRLPAFRDEADRLIAAQELKPPSLT